MSHQKTSKRIGKLAAKTLSDPNASRRAKRLAGSALVNRPHRRNARRSTRG